jgi:hypothetical protein
MMHKGIKKAVSVTSEFYALAAGMPINKNSSLLPCLTCAGDDRQTSLSALNLIIHHPERTGYYV